MQHVGVIDGNTKIQKLTFLFELQGQKRGVRAGHLRFSRYRYGPYSWQLPDLVQFLEDGEFITRTTKTLTKRGRFVLEYALPDLQGAAAEALELTSRIARDYGHRPASNLKKLVYAMKVPVHDKGGEMIRMKDLPIGIDIVHPSAVPSLVDPVDVVGDLLDDLAHEFELSAREIDPTSPRVRRRVAEGVARAVSELTH